MNYPWPGNVRELANAVEHSVICSRDGVVALDSLPDTLRDYCEARFKSTVGVGRDRVADESSRIEEAVRKANGNKTLAAQMLGIDRSTLWRRMQRLGIG